MRNMLQHTRCVEDRQDPAKRFALSKIQLMLLRFIWCALYVVRSFYCMLLRLFVFNYLVSFIDGCF